MRPTSVLLACMMIVSIAPLACAQGSGETARAAGQDCEPLETRTPNADYQRPAFEGQTRACGVTSDVAYEVTVIARGLDHPWAVEPLPDGDFLVTELPGTMRIVGVDGTIGPAIAGVPPVAERNQGGLLDVALAPDFDSTRMIYWSYTEPRGDGENATSVARGILSADGRELNDVEVILRSLPAYDGGHHFGSRLLFTPDGHLFVTLGERAQRPIRDQAQDLDSHLGKVLRISPDGSVPDDNPFVGRDDAYPEVWSFGHRNIQAAALDPEGRLWTIEHGPQGGDELNLIEPGVNYGWPVMSFGQDYSGQPIPNSRTQREGMRQPVYYWDPVIAPAGAQWYTGDAFPAWQGSLFVGALRQQRLVRLEIELVDADSELTPEATRARVTAEEHLLAERQQRVRDVRQGPDGALYVVTDETAGELWKIAPAE